MTGLLWQWEEPQPKYLSYLRLVLAFGAAVFAFESYLDWRQLKAIQKLRPPKILGDSYDKAEYKKTQSYNIDKWYFGKYKGLWSVCFSTFILLAGFMPFLWAKSASLVARVGLDPKNEIYVAITYELLESLQGLIMGLPWSIYSTFVIEQRHGFNKQTPGLFVVDILKSIGLGIVILPLFVGGFTFVLQNTSPFIALYLWLFILGIQVIALTIYPTVIAPLFNKFDPLPEGPLRHAIEELAGSLKFPLRKLFVIDGSKRSAHSNAYMYGFWKNKRIVLFDTLIEQCSQEEVVAVLAHELGHWKLSHTTKNFVLQQGILLANLGLFTFARNSPRLFNSFGFTEVKPAFIAFTLFQLISSPVDEVIGFFNNMLSRKFEFQADNFAVELGHASELQGALRKLDAKNKSAQNVDHWYSTYHYSHPPLVERLSGIQVEAKKAQ
ncbi:hypothetical protein WJX74_009873 [Apatococcus lobatus]|uniref:CAAX prenyl protease n=1 Tax=Apatococcus lobatus TaxID=904363 RepID=A0AAW1RD99_9CHLO